MEREKDSISIFIFNQIVVETWYIFSHAANAIFNQDKRSLRDLVYKQFYGE